MQYCNIARPRPASTAFPRCWFVPHSRPCFTLHSSPLSNPSLRPQSPLIHLVRTKSQTRIYKILNSYIRVCIFVYMCSIIDK